MAEKYDKHSERKALKPELFTSFFDGYRELYAEIADLNVKFDQTQSEAAFNPDPNVRMGYIKDCINLDKLINEKQDKIADVLLKAWGLTVNKMASYISKVQIGDAVVYVHACLKYIDMYYGPVTEEYTGTCEWINRELEHMCELLRLTIPAVEALSYNAAEDDD